MIQQIKNDMIINQSVSPSDTEQNSIYYVDNREVEQTIFSSISLDTIYYINRIMSYDETNDGDLKITYKGYTSHYYTDYKFVPKHFELSFDESDKLVLEVTHPTKGEFYAYGFDKDTAKQGVNPYHMLDFTGSFSSGQNLLNRQIDEMRFVLTIADSIYVHDFKIEDFYTHDH